MSDFVCVPMSTARDRLVASDTRHDPRVQQLLTDQPSAYRPAAVFIGLLYKDGSPMVLLTLRSSKLQHHANTVSFPGGKVDAEDVDHVQAALREAKEEVGLEASNIDVFSTFPPMFASPNFLTVPVVGFIKDEFEFRINKDEVAEAFYLPLDRFLKDERHTSDVIQRDSSSAPFIIHRFTDTVESRSMVTWGFTANFCCVVAAIVFNAKGFCFASRIPISPEDFFEQCVRVIQQRFHLAKLLESSKM